MNMQQQLNQYIDRIYRAVLQPESITDIMNDLRQVVDAPYTAFQIEHLYTHELSQASLIAYDDSAINQYSDYFVHVDPWTKRALEQGLLNQNFLASQRVMSDKEYCATEFYQDWGREHGVRHAMGSSFEIDDQHIVKLTFQRHCDQDPFDQTQEEFMNHLHPHFQQFVRLSNLFSVTRPDCHNFSTLDLFSRPIWLLNQQSQLQYANIEAEHWLSGQRLFGMSGRQLVCRHAPQQEMFRAAVARSACRNGVSRAADRIRLLNGTQEENIWLMPLTLPDNPGQPLIMVIGPRSLPGEGIISQQFGLTGRQGQLCAQLITGKTLQSAAENLNISVNTARNQLATCFRLLQVNNQSELIQLLTNALNFPMFAHDAVH